MRERGTPPGPSLVWAAGKLVGVRCYGDLRGLCAWCGAPSTRELRLDVTASSGRGFRAAGLVGEIAERALLSTRTVIDVSICDRHAGRRRWLRGLGWSMVGAAAAAMALAFVPGRDSDWPLYLFTSGIFLLTPLGLILAWLGGRGPRGGVAVEEGVYVRGIAPAVRAQLPTNAP